MLSCVKHENSFITLGLMTDHPCLKTDVSDDGVLCITCYSAQHFKIFLFGNMSRVATVREKVLENEKFSRSGKSQGITFSVSEI